MVVSFLYQLQRSGVTIALAENGNLAIQAPKGVLTADMQARLKQHKTEVIAFLQQQPCEPEDGVWHIPPGEPLPASAQQQSLLFFYQYQQSRGTEYNMCQLYQMQGQLNLQALERAVHHIQHVNPIYRTRFVNNGDRWYQQIEEKTDAIFTLRPLADDWRTAAQHPFDLQTAPLIHFTVFSDGDNRHNLAIVQHHIVSDGWSVGLLLEQINRFYAHFCHNASALPSEKPALSYADYAYWQYHYQRQSKGRERQNAFWKDYLNGARETHIPLNNPRPSIMTFEGNSTTLTLDPQLTAKIRESVKVHRSSLFIYLFTVYNLLLSRLTAQSDILVGTVFANRQPHVFEKTQGFFANTCVLRTQIDPTERFSDKLTASRHNFAQVYAHHSLPFDAVVSQCCDLRPGNRLPLIQSVFVAQNAQQKHELALDGLLCQPVAPDSHSSNFDLVFHLLDQADTLCFHIEYNNNVFNKDGIDLLCQQFTQLINAVTDNPHLPMSHYEHRPAETVSIDVLHQTLCDENDDIDDICFIENERLCFLAMDNLQRFCEVVRFCQSHCCAQSLPHDYRLVKRISYGEDGRVDIPTLKQLPALRYVDLLHLNTMIDAAAANNLSLTLA